MSLQVPRGWSRRPARARPRPAARATQSRPGPGRRADGPVVEFGLVKGKSGGEQRAAAGGVPQLDRPVTGLGARPHTAVRLPEQNLQAWRYPGLRPVGVARELTVYTVPTSAGVATVACAAPPASAAALAAQCDAIAGHPSAAEADRLPDRPERRLRDALNGTIGELQQTTQSEETTLQGCTDPRGSGGRRAALASAYDGAAGAARRTRAEPGGPTGKRHAGRSATGSRARVPRRPRARRPRGDADAYRAASAAFPPRRAR